MMGLAAGVVIAAGVPRLLAAASNDAEPGRADALQQEAPEITAPDAAATPPGEGGQDARSAVEGFLAAEQRRDYRASFGFLSDADRGAFRSPAGWIAEHADVMAPVTDFTIEDVRESAQVSEVTTIVEFRPTLDAVVGLVPGRTRATWSVVAGDGGYGVDMEASSMTPLYPHEAEAVPAVRAWVEERQPCNDPGANLIGNDQLADQLCDATPDTVEVGSPVALSEVDARAFQTAFGPEVRDWARAVPVSGPVDLRVVVAPIGEEWQAIGILGPRA